MIVARESHSLWQVEVWSFVRFAAQLGLGDPGIQSTRGMDAVNE
jgi:hypothetical protein